MDCDCVRKRFTVAQYQGRHLSEKVEAPIGGFAVFAVAQIEITDSVVKADFGTYGLDNSRSGPASAIRA